jgi:hypothetical protein
MGITIGIDNDGLSVALGGSDSKVDDYLGGRRTELGKYGISNGRAFRSILRTTHSQPGRNSAAGELGTQLVLRS